MEDEFDVLNHGFKETFISRIIYKHQGFLSKSNKDACQRGKKIKIDNLFKLRKRK